MFNPIAASEEIRRSFVDYITTTYSMEDEDYRREFTAELRREGMVTKGPYLDIGGAYEPARTLEELTEAGAVSPLFAGLEPVPEEERELRMQRPLYSHQEEAVLRAVEGRSLAVTTGTGSGKTECFLIPIIDALLKEAAAGTLDDGVRAIVIYPMNALANDQIKRMRAMFRGYPAIRFGVYNGNTEHEQQRALQVYRKTHRDASGTPEEPLPNEVISREVMQSRPPHILITNYSMLEYMLLRPRDDAVFSGAKLRYIVLDEAHIYRGATGMETSLLMRRLRARISDPESVQYILTSATLGGPDSDPDILTFAERLCGVPKDRWCIVRAREKRPAMVDQLVFPAEMYTRLRQEPEHTARILGEYGADFDPEGTDEEKLYELFLRSRLFGVLRETAAEPVTVTQIWSEFSKVCPVTEDQVVDFVAVCARAERDRTCLIKPRYHFFARALEGAYVTLGKTKRLFLQRRDTLENEEGKAVRTVFEAAVCQDCGRISLVGESVDRQSGKTMRRYLRQTSKRTLEEGLEYWCVCRDGDEDLSDEAEDLVEGILKSRRKQKADTYVLCSICGAITPEADAAVKQPCAHDPENYVRVRQARKLRNEIRCPACQFGNVRRFYLGADAATAVLGMELYEQLPDEEVRVEEPAAGGGRKGLFRKERKPKTVRTPLVRQFLCFSDSRSEAAFFASYMERSYREFIRRRGIWHVAEEYRKEGTGSVSMGAFVNRLSRLFEVKGSFAEWDQTGNGDTGSLKELSLQNAWIAVLNEMFSSRRGTSLVSMGVVAFQYMPNDEAADAFQEICSLPPGDTRALLELLVQDGVFTGALNAGKHLLTDEEREYIFYASVPRRLVKVRTPAHARKSWLSGWCGRARAKGGFYPSTRLMRLTSALGVSEEEADELLDAYWEDVFNPETEEFVLDANDFRVLIGGTDQVSFWRCSRCGRVTPFNLQNRCANVRCSGRLVPFDAEKVRQENHYARLYQSSHMEPLHMKEHTAQLAKEKQTLYQEAFVSKRINALSCSTTFEMGVDLGSLETVYMRDIPPSPASYVQRAGRAGRSAGSAAFVLTYAKLSSHDLSFYQDPVPLIRGSIQVPVFVVENEKILRRHINAVAFSAFFSENEDIYASDNQTVFLNEGGYEKFKEYLTPVPPELADLLKRSIPRELHERLGLTDGSWTRSLIGEDGTLEIAVQDFRETVQDMENALEKCRAAQDDKGAWSWSRALRYFRCGANDGAGRKSLIEFLARNNVLPKYGFPVDTVELIPDISRSGSSRGLQLARDLQLAIAEYAPGAQVIADNRMYTSRYIRRLPGRPAQSWEYGYYCVKCPECEQPNFTRVPMTGEGRECVSCHSVIPRIHWARTLEPRMGFYAEDGNGKEVPMRRPERDYRTEDCYIGDPARNRIQSVLYQVGGDPGRKIRLESTTNDSLVVVGQSFYHVCPVCGYADEREIPADHVNSRGYKCSNQEGKGMKVRLSHDFKTDVARITFCQDAGSWATMLSVLYALLEGLSRELGIERSDIKGCLFRTSAEGFLVYSVILYDAVPGGAGHVRRLVTQDGAVFQRVLERAIAITDSCTCDTSCYSCLRNYSNQKIHDQLNRHKASEFLKNWQGKMEPVPDDVQEEEPAAEESVPAPA